MPILVDKVLPAIKRDAHGHLHIYPDSRASCVAVTVDQNRGRVDIGDISLTWDNDRRVWGINPIVRPNIRNVLGHYVPLGLLWSW